ncbi:hypothetical protein FRB96_004085 [Tulasnella sp. 330]|nr:hypothetical protein FRB96_004085 [Tulasnella sp. 330]
MALFTSNDRQSAESTMPKDVEDHHNNSLGEWWLQPRAATSVAHPNASALPVSSSFDYFSFTSAAHTVSTASTMIVEPPSPISSSRPDSPIGGLPTSPAAMFLSGFVEASASRSSSMPSHNKDDDEEEEDQSPTRRQRLRVRTTTDEDEDIVGGYQLGRVIGNGAFSTIRRATSVPKDSLSPTTVVAVKIVHRNDSRPGASEARTRLSHEAKIWSQLSHEHVLPLFSSLEAPEATYLFTLYCPAGNLLDIINSHKADGLEGVGMDDAGMLFRQIVRGLKYLHEVVRLVHGDIKLENVLVDDQGSCRIADFGLSKWLGNAPPSASEGAVVATPGLPVHLSLLRPRGRHARTANSPFGRGSIKAHTASESHHNNNADLPTHPQHWFPPGSLPYASPELLAPHLTPLPPSPAQDVWALGCVLYALLFGKLPFSDPFEPRLQMKIVRGIWKLPSNCRRSVGGFTASRSRKGSRSRSRNRGFSQARRPGTGSGGRERSSSARRPQLQRSPHNATFLSNGPVFGGVASRMRSKSRGRRQESGGRHRSVSPAPANNKAIGRVAENVLHGCLCVNLGDRWSVAMIDEVGWGVGWDLDVDEAGEEYDEVEDNSTSEEMSPTATGSSGASMISTGGGALATADKDRFGNRYYIAPGDQTRPSLSISRPPSALYSTTLDMVTSPTIGTPHQQFPRPSFLQPVAEMHSNNESVNIGTDTENISIKDKSNDESIASSADERLDITPIMANPTDSANNDAAAQDNKPARARGKRGKTSRSSSRHGSAVQSPQMIPPLALPADMDPFHAFRLGHVPLAFSTPSSKNPSRAASAVPSRASSRERGVEQRRGSSDVLTQPAFGLVQKDWPRGRTRDNINTSSPWRGPSAASLVSGITPLTQSSSCPLPAATSVERSIDSWRPPPFNKRNKESSMSPSPSPSPSTPMDGSLMNIKGEPPVMKSPSHSRGRVGRGAGAGAIEGLQGFPSTSPVVSSRPSMNDSGAAKIDGLPTTSSSSSPDESMEVSSVTPGRGWPAWPW